ncbi:TRAP transporter substrate-binding protein [Entomospira entomophila]|uniref:TRAP transporter substrate-binding protein n=1 Tax=Entomospira entomophila TaxID=2719988 RepID=A0A968GC75_9SPIO|nr:TRAP transporter substrate-binding protein [Entomospira entomophilus]NIZ40721.1 TRAP transporter substrate-binding protein [Entomospira entomophilus]WDI34934.1 TRAP transporter substrate-binding protein [Entomospira entomophilus]
MMKRWVVMGLGLLMMACGKGAGDSITLRVGHNHTQTNPSHLALEFFAREVAERSDGTMKVQIFPNGTLGDDRVMMEQVQRGSLDMVRVSAGTLENFDDNFTLFSLPYLFTSEEHFLNVMRSDLIDGIYSVNSDKNDFRVLTYQDTGVRSFYTRFPIHTPEDLRGKKIRVMSSQNMIRMMELLGATATPLPYGEVYMALQQGMVDGAENNPQALTLDKHGEVAKFFVYSKHLRLPDFVVMSEKSWQKLSPEQQKIVKEAMIASTAYHHELWNAAIEQMVSEARDKMGVTFLEVDEELFVQRIQPIYDDLAKNNPRLYTLVEEIRAMG